MLRVAGFTGVSGATFLTCGAAAADGALTLDYNAGDLRLRFWDAAGALVDTLSCGAVDATEHELTIEWNAAAGTASVSESGAPLDSYAGAAWTPEAGDVTPLYIGADSAGANAAGCLLAVVEGFDF